jgi:predicted DNA-binding ribbon-helix-helix protein
MRLEPELWEALADICRMERIGLSEMIRNIELRGHPGGRTSAVRVFIVQYFRGIVTGHAGRGNQSQSSPPLRAAAW